MLALVGLLVAVPSGPVYGRVSFPRDVAVVNVRDLGAKGDGRADDTEVLQKALDGVLPNRTHIVYVPNGTYRVTRTLVAKHALGPWLYGESRDGVRIRLDDGAKDVLSVIRTHPRDANPGSADWFMRTLKNFTVDVGNNPGVDGIRYFSNNSGILQNVRVAGRGKVGINSGFMGQNGPNLIQDVVVEGFETGILSQWIWGQTVSRATLRNLRKTGLSVEANVVAAEGLTVEGTPEPVVVNYPNDWTWWGGVLALVNANLIGNQPNGAAIRNRSILYARNVRTRGFGQAIRSETSGGNVAGPNVGEFLSQPAFSLFDAPGSSLNLPIKAEPTLPWENDPAKWLCADTFGVVPGDNQDDTAAIQRAMAEAARLGKTVVYFRGNGGPDPNHITLNGEVKVPAPVRHVIGLGWARLLGPGRLVVDDRSAPIVKFENIDAFGGPPIMLENRSAKNTMRVENCGVRVVGAGRGDIFMTSCPALVDLRVPGQKLWARQLNPEGDDDPGLVRNAGGDLWAFGVKHEGRGVRFATSRGGRTEVFGVFVYGPGIPENDLRPMFTIDNASLTVAGLREIAFDAPTYRQKVRQKRGNEERILRQDGWIGWSLFSSRP